MDDSSGEKCETVIVFECMDLSIGQRVNVSGLSCVSNMVLRCWDSYKVIYVTLSSKVYCLYGFGLRGASLGHSTAVTLEVYLESLVADLAALL